jgi:hypothetical protein
MRALHGGDCVGAARGSAPGIRAKLDFVDALLRFLLIFVLFAVEVDVVTGEAAADQEGKKDHGPADGGTIPGALSGHCGGRGFDQGEGGTRAQNELEVPGHEVKVRLTTYLAP